MRPGAAGRGPFRTQDASMSESLTQTPPPVSAPAQSQPPAKPRRRRWPKVLLGLVALLLLLVWFAPTIVAKTALRNRLARSAAADLNGTLDIGGASLGWFSPVELRDVTLTDPQGRVVARIAKVTSSKSLFSLARDHSDPGEFTLERPELEVVCEKHATNLEDLLRKFLEDTTPPAPTRTPLVVRITGGMLTLKDAETGRTGEFRDLEATVTIPAARSESVAAKVSANAPGRVEVEASVGESGTVKLVANGFALESLAPLLRRVDPGLSLAGSLTADVTATWAKDAASIDGTLGVKGLAVAAPALNGDTLRLASADLPIKATLAGRAVRVERADLTSDIGSLSLAGTFDPDEPLDKLFDRPGVKLDATVELAKLAAALPKLLRIRDGTVVREGKLVVKVESKPAENGTTWTGSVNTSALKATRAGKEIRWEEPLSVEFVGRAKSGRLPTFEKLICKSDFVAVNAQVSPESVRAAANVYLDKLAERLADFVDLGGATLDGRGSAWVVASRTPTGEFKADAGLELKQFAFTDREGKGVREPELKAQLAATGQAPDAGPVSVSTATLVLTAGADELHLKLLEPIPDTKQLAAGKLDARLAGELARWRKRLAAVVVIPEDYKLAGTASAHGVVRFGGDTVNIDRLVLSVEKARFAGAGIDLDEPNVNAVADVTVDRKTGTTTFDHFTINSAPLSIARGQLVIESPNGPLVVRGGGPAVTDLNRLGKTVGMFADPRGPSAMYGRGTGPIRFRHAGGVTTFGGTLDVTDFAFGPAKVPDWAEKRLRLELDGFYTSSTDTVAFTAAKLERAGLSLAASGTIGKFDTTTDANLAGTLTYDMAKLTPKLRELLGGNFAAEGKGSKPVSVVGSLTPQAKPGAKRPPNLFASLTVEVGLGWDSLKAYGFDVGASELRAKLADGFVRVTPVVAPIGGGEVTLRPSARLDPAPGGVSFAKGPLVEKAKLNPEVCAGALGYALPAVANSGKAEGEISVTLDDNHIPLGDTRKASAKATVVIHKATVTAGPVVGVIAKLLGADNATMTLANEQSVPVRVESGRVHHENLTIKLGGYFVKTTGSVGFDGTLDMIADVPIPGGLPGFKNTPALAKALTGKRVNVPIRGTLAAPTLDPKAFQAAIAKLAQEAAKDIGKDLLNKELGKLFPDGMPGPGGLFPIPKK
jgi:translocation and assembly module TamB